MEMPCSHCGIGLVEAAVFYDGNGAISCSQCLTKQQVEESNAGVADKVKGIAYANVFFGLVAFVFNPFLVVSIGTIVNSGYVFRSLADAETSKRLQPYIGKMTTAAIVGSLLGGIAGVLRIVVAFAD